MDGMNSQIFAIELPSRLLAQHHQTTPFLPEDIHICGNCKQSFTDIRVFLDHKNECNAFMSSATAALLGTATPRVNLQMLSSEEPLLQVMINDADQSVIIQQDDGNVEDTELSQLGAANANGEAVTLDAAETTLLQCDNIEIVDDSRREVQIDEEDVASLLASQFGKEPVYLPNDVLSDEICIEDKTADGVQVEKIGEKRCTNSSLYLEETIGGIDALNTSEQIMHVSEENVIDNRPATDYGVEIEIVCNDVDTSFAKPKAKSKVRKKEGSATKSPKKVTWNCESCDFITPYRSDLTRHVRSRHTGEKPYECGTCSQRFARRDKLHTHERIHTGERPYKCHFCTYAAIDSACLKKHLRRHTNERPFKCQFCPYSAKDTSQLTVHLRRHTGDTPFVCQLCQRAFRTSTVLNRHAKVHKISRQVIPCNECSYKATSRFDLRGHKKLNHSKGTAQLHCDVCNFKARNKKDLNQHQEGMHSDSSVLNSSSIIIDLSLDDMMKKKDSGNRRSKRNIRRCKPSESDLAVNSGINPVHGFTQTHSSGLATDDLKQYSTRKQRPGGGSTKARTPRVLTPRVLCQKMHHCNYCPISFVREDSLRIHLRQHQGTAAGSLSLSSNVVWSKGQEGPPPAMTDAPQSEVFVFDNIPCDLNCD